METRPLPIPQTPLFPLLLLLLFSSVVIESFATRMEDGRWREGRFFRLVAMKLKDNGREGEFSLTIMANNWIRFVFSSSTSSTSSSVSLVAPPPPLGLFYQYCMSSLDWLQPLDTASLVGSQPRRRTEE